MSSTIEKEILCPKCGDKETLSMHIGTNISELPHIKTEILNQTIFDKTCKKCGYERQIIYPMVYHDPKKAYMIALTPVAGKAKTISAPNELKEIIKRRVKSLEELKEKIFIFDEKLNDVAIEMLKNSICEVISKKNNTNKNKAYFCRVCDNQSLEFAIFLYGEKKPIYHTAKMEIYKKYDEISRSIFNDDTNEFLRVGPTLARVILKKYESL